MRALLWLLVSVSLVHVASASRLALYVMDVPPMTTMHDIRRGVLGDITQEAMKRSGFSAQVLDYPSPRALTTVSSTHDALIIPLARLKDRELNFTWISPLMKVDRAFFSLRHPLNSFEDAKKLKAIGVARSAAAVEILLEAGFSSSQIVEINQGDTGPSMLIAGRIDAWYNPVAEAELLLKKVDRKRQVIRGKSIGSTINYLACSKICNARIVDKMQQSLKSMAKDGTIKTISEKYGHHEGLELNLEF